LFPTNMRAHPPPGPPPLRRRRAPYIATISSNDFIVSFLSDSRCPHLFGMFLGATFNGAFRAIFVSGPTSTSWRFADFPTGLYKGDFGYGSRLMALSSASHESTFKVPSDCYTMAAHRVLGLTTELASCSEVPMVQKGSLRVSWVRIFVDGIGHFHVG
jgi:hypothetical protein